MHRGRAHAAPLRREHPVRVVEHVERPEEAFGRRPAAAAPGLPPGVREGQEAQARLDRDAVAAPRESPSGPAGSSARKGRSRARRPRLRRARPASRAGSGRSRAARATAGETSKTILTGRYVKRLKCTPSSRVSVLRRAEHDGRHGRVRDVEAHDAAPVGRRERHAQCLRARHRNGRAAERRAMPLENVTTFVPREQVRVALQLHGQRPARAVEARVGHVPAGPRVAVDAAHARRSAAAARRRGRAPSLRSVAADHRALQRQTTCPRGRIAPGRAARRRAGRPSRG